MEDVVASNPQAPPLTAEEKEILESDRIGDTAYSKKWVLSVLLHMMNDEKDDRNVSPKSEKVVHDEEEKSNNGSSINAELEEELCELWDMTMDSDVSKYLLSEDGIDLILDVILRTASLRKLEICIGILANMACTAEVCKEMLAHSRLSDVILYHIDNSDVRTLIELARLISVCLSHKDLRSKWIVKLKARGIVDKLLFILENSLNLELLDGVTNIVDQLCDFDDDVLADLATTEVVSLVCDVYRRTAVKHPQTVQGLLHILQLISTTEKGVSSLASVKDSGDIAEIILIQGSKYFTPLQSNLSSLVSSCCVLNVIMSANEKKEDTFHKKDFKMLLTVMSLIEELLHDEDDTADQKIVKSKYSEAVVDFLIVLIERFVHAQMSEKMVTVLRDREGQISRTVSLLGRFSEYSSTVKKLVDALRMHHILKSSDDKDSDEGSRASDAAQTKEESETGKDDYEVPHVEGESDRA